MLDKNPKQILDSNFEQIKNEFLKNSLSTILCSKPFTKSIFLNKIIDASKDKIIFLDFDLLYTGYITSNLIERNDRVSIYHLNKKNWIIEFSKILQMISKEKFLIIVDSLNGFNNMFDEKDSGRFINASIMLLSSIGRDKGTSVIAAAMARKKEDGWILVPGGRHVIDSKLSGMYFLEHKEAGMILDSVKEKSGISFRLK